MCVCVLFLSSESLIRTAFQCLQLVVTDFLPTMPCACLQIVVDVAGSFGLQNQELNISLTSIGLLVGERSMCKLNIKQQQRFVQFSACFQTFQQHFEWQKHCSTHARPVGGAVIWLVPNVVPIFFNVIYSSLVQRNQEIFTVKTQCVSALHHNVFELT